jgi:hypothetical protein
VWGWIVAVGLYLLSIGLFRWLGGIAAAGDAVQRWGRAVAERHRQRLVSTPRDRA